MNYLFCFLFIIVVPTPPIDLHIIKDKAPHLNITWETSPEYAIFYSRIVKNIHLCYGIQFPFNETAKVN